MKRIAVLASVVALVIVTAGAFAQTKPNFTGKWTLIADPNAPASAGRGSGLGRTFAAAQDDKTLTVTTTTPPVGEVKTVYNLDGSETKNPITFNGDTVERNSKIKWDAGKLVVTTTVNFAGNPGEMTQVWSLDVSGNLKIESTNNLAGNNTTAVATYRKG